jgi:large repetitive protein
LPGGTVTFTANGVVTPVPLDALGRATLTTAALPAGSNVITADYTGDAVFLASTGSATQTVNKTATTTVVSSGTNPSLVGQAVTFTATVSSALATALPGGTVTFTANGVVTPVPLDALGRATLTTPDLPAGSHLITADYSGDTAFTASTGSTTQTVNKTATVTVLVSSLNPSNVGSAVTFTATVSPATPTGTVLFTVDGGTTSVPIVAGQASISTVFTSTGAHLVGATYSGDAAFLASSSPQLTQTVGSLLGPTTTVVTSNRVPTANLGQNITFTATVRLVTGTVIPTGALQFNIDGVDVGAALTLNAQGRATFSTATLSAGSHNVMATYIGSTIFGGSGSATFVQVVNQAASTTVVTSSVNPSVSGQTVTFTARVSPLAATGTVQFRLDGVDVGGAVVLDATGRAQLVTSLLTVGSHTVSAVYAGNVNYRTSTSANLTQTVNKSNSRTVVVSSGSPVVRNTTVVFIATVTARGSGTGTPTGTVQFRIDGVNTGATVSLNTSGQATYSTSTLSVGRHTISAVYAGNGSFNASTSGNITQRIL